MPKREVDIGLDVTGAIANEILTRSKRAGP